MSAPRAAAIGDRVDERISEEPAPKSRGGVEPFPLTVFPKIIQRYVREGADALGCPVDFFAVPVLVLAGLVVGASRALQVKPGWLESPRFYVAIVGEPGDAKTPAQNRVAAPLHRRQREEKGRFDAAMAAHEAAAERAKRDRTDPPAVKPTLVRWYTSDTTTEALATILAENPRGVAIIRDELTGWVRSMDQYRAQRGADRQFFLSSWSGEPLVVDRKSNPGGVPIIVPHPFLSVVGGLPPDMLHELTDERGREDGFIHRLLFAYPEAIPPGAWSDAAISEEAEHAWHRVIEHLGALEPDVDEHGTVHPKVVFFTEAAKRLRAEFYTLHSAERAHPQFAVHLRGAWAKLRSYFPRLALTLHELRAACGEAHGEAVDEVSTLGAGALVDYFKSHAERVYRQLRVRPDDKRAAALERWIRSHGGQCSARDVAKHEVAGIKKASDAGAALRDLQDRGKGRLTSGRRGGVGFVLGTEEP